MKRETKCPLFGVVKRVLQWQRYEGITESSDTALERITPWLERSV
jgi:hypothetical protein